MLNRFNIGGKGIEEQENLGITHRQLNEVYKYADILAGDYSLRLSANVCTPLCVVNPDDYPHIQFSVCSKNAFKMPLTLDLNGNLRLCNHSPVEIGNIFKDDYDGMFTSPYVVAWNRTIPLYCKECKKYPRCFAGCRAAAEQLGFGNESPDPVLLP
jgi:radical SAM protein with 4Fe4S-binding SPASM domain